MSRRNIVLIQHFTSEYTYILQNLALHLVQLTPLGSSDHSTTLQAAISWESLYMHALTFAGHILKVYKP